MKTKTNRLRGRVSFPLTYTTLCPNSRIGIYFLRAPLSLLTVRRRNIRSLAGITTIPNHRRLDLEANKISDISPLSRLNRLTGLYLGNNNINDVTPLRSLERLHSLDLL